MGVYKEVDRKRRKDVDGMKIVGRWGINRNILECKYQNL